MKKYVLVIFTFLFCDKLFSQIKGEYKGLFTQKNERYKQVTEKDTIVNGKTSKWTTFQKVEWDGEKRLVLKSNGVYVFEYLERGEPCAARASLRNCTGKYKINKDTLYLTSTYKQTDFCTVTEQIIDSIANGKIMIVTHYPNNILSPETFINGFDLKLNDRLIGEFKIKDTVYCAALDIKDIFISCCSPYQMEWYYSPKNKNSNYFTISLKREINTEDIFMNNCKLLIKNSSLILLDGEYLQVKDNRYIKNK
ncbi:hypothetical protein [Ferruginibacter sp. SUN106]|uniref:hypothetical protein n=1 Tax=Ferruginibacter sp. SUN106 TaxID=2978348 RepID=UPI003D36D20A